MITLNKGQHVCYVVADNVIYEQTFEYTTGSSKKVKIVSIHKNKPFFKVVIIGLN